MIGSPGNPGSGTINLLCAFDYKGLMRNWLRFVNYLRRPSDLCRIDSYTELASFGSIGVRQNVGRPTGASAADPGVHPPRTYVCATASGAVLFSPCSHSWKRSR